MDKKRTEAQAKRKAAMRDCFLDALTEFLTGDAGSKSIYLEMGKPWAKEWAKLRSATPLHGYVSGDEARGVLKEFLDW